MSELTSEHRYSEQFTNAHFIKVDVDDVPDVAQELGVRAMPTFILVKKGEKVGEVVGMNPPALLAAIEKLAGPTAAA
jgi:thioredoxin 1